MFDETVSYHLAFFAGVLSFFSPCVLPLIPAYFTFITGFSLEDLSGPNIKIRKKVFFATVAYVLGFSFVFILMGVSASYFGNIASKYKALIRIAGGVIIIMLGIHLTGLIRIRRLEFEHRLQIGKKPLHFLGTFFVGMAFGAGWSPCIGPLLGSILIIASGRETVWDGILLLCIYSAGLAIPFLILSVFINFLLELIKKMSKYMKYINAFAGILLICMGLLLVSNHLVF